jgi:hypothetical protein
MTDDPTETMEPAEALRWLNSEEAVRLLSKSRRRKIGQRLRKGVRTTDAKLAQRIRAARVGLYVFVCSSWWADEVYGWLLGLSLLAEGAADNAATATRRGFYPPRVERDGCGMLVCIGCGRPTPRSCVGTSGHCDDCRYADMADKGMEMPRGVTFIDQRRMRNERESGRQYRGE